MENIENKKQKNRKTYLRKYKKKNKILFNIYIYICYKKNEQLKISKFKSICLKLL